MSSANPPAGARRERLGWYSYDWANSAFSTTVVAVFLGPYLTAIARAAAGADGHVTVLGLSVYADSLYLYCVSLSVLLQALVLPVLGAISDYSRRRKPLLGLFAGLGAAATVGLYFATPERWAWGAAVFVLANVCFGAAMVFYNAYLPDIAAPAERDRVSSVGWAAGYLGGGILLALNLVLVARAPALGLDPGEAARVSLASAGLWWGLFTLVTLATLRSHGQPRALPPGGTYLTVGFHQLGHTLRGLPRYRQTLLFLAAYLLYNDAVQTVIASLTQFGQQELGLGLASLAQLALMVQFVAFGGALFFAWVARRLGTKRAIMISLTVWIAGTVYAWGLLRGQADFSALAAVGALVLGGTQALSRSAFSRTIPAGQEAEYFSLYEVSERGTSWLGPLLLGVVLQLTGSYRLGLLSLLLLFGAGLAVLARVDLARAEAEARRPAPE
jgi:UMF1 family MFS transporter